jgi:hypothetical protein
MAKQRKRKQSKEQMMENTAFYNYLLKKHERLTFILDNEINKNRDISEEDIKLLTEEYTAFEHSDILWAANDLRDGQEVTQLTIESDRVSEK